MRFALLAVFSIVMLGSCTKKTINNPVVNQAFSAVYTIQPNQWVEGTGANAGTYSATLTVPELDNVIAQSGGVETYLSFDVGSSTPTYETMPEVVDNVAYGSIHSAGTVTIDLRGADGSALTSAITAPVSIKVVLIDATPLD